MDEGEHQPTSEEVAAIAVRLRLREGIFGKDGQGSNRCLSRHPLRGFTTLVTGVAHGFADSPVALFRHPFGIGYASRPTSHERNAVREL